MLVNGTRTMNAGTFNASAQCTWPNGQVRTFNHLYTNQPFPPPP